MPKLINKTDQPITATTGHTVEPGDGLEVSQSTLERLATEPYIARTLRKGQLVIEQDIAPAPDAPITRESMARMKRADLLEVLDAHGISEDHVEGKYVDELREMAARIVFSDL